MPTTLLALIIGAVSVSLFLAYAVYTWCHSGRAAGPVRRTQTLAYTYSATATGQPQHPTYLDFPAPRLARREPAVKPTILKNFTDELWNIGFRYFLFTRSLAVTK